jgi:DNA-binding MarR family transcriptional regulator
MRLELLENLDNRLTNIVRMLIANVHNRSVCISPARDKTLLIVGFYNGIRIKELASILHITSGAATQEVTSLEADDWLTRAPNPKDHRETIVRLTSKGETALRKIKSLRLERMADLFAGLDDRELRSLVDLITKVSNSDGKGTAL